MLFFKHSVLPEMGNATIISTTGPNRTSKTIIYCARNIYKRWAGYQSMCSTTRAMLLQLELIERVVFQALDLNISLNQLAVQGERG